MYHYYWNYYNYKIPDSFTDEWTNFRLEIDSDDYWDEDWDSDNYIEYYVHITETEVEESKNVCILPEKYYLYQNHPNPFNPITHIKYDLPKSTAITIFIYNLQGQKVKTLVDEYEPAGRYTAIWNGTDDMGEKVASGVYLYTMQTDEFNSRHKLLLLK